MKKLLRRQFHSLTLIRSAIPFNRGYYRAGFAGVCSRVSNLHHSTAVLRPKNIVKNKNEHWKSNKTKISSNVWRQDWYSVSTSQRRRHAVHAERSCAPNHLHQSVEKDIIRECSATNFVDLVTQDFYKPRNSGAIKWKIAALKIINRRTIAGQTQNRVEVGFVSHSILRLAKRMRNP